MLPSQDTKAAAHINQRTRLSLSYSFEESVSTRISVQDLRLWGEHMTIGTRPSFGLYEAWIRLDFNERLSVQAGRQELRYDNQRLMAVNDWALSARSHDAIVLMHENDNSRLHIGAGFNQSQDRLFGTEYGLNNYKTLNYIWYSTRISPLLNASIHFIADGYENPEDSEELNIRLSWASYITLGNEGLQLRFYPAFQHGKTLYGEDISAWYMMAEAFSPLTGNWSATLGAEIFSGKDHLKTGDDKFRAFDDLYGVGHGRNGYMDYFTSFPGHTRQAGLINPYLKNRFIINPSTDITADLHLFFLQNNYPDPDDSMRPIDKYLGTEIDLVLTHRFNEITQLQFGYSVMFGSESMEVIKGGSSDEFAHWAFLMIRLSPKFL